MKCANALETCPKLQEFGFRVNSFVIYEALLAIDSFLPDGGQQPWWARQVQA